MWRREQHKAGIMAFKYILILGTMIAAVACGAASGPSRASDGSGSPTPTGATSVAPALSPVAAQEQVGSIWTSTLRTC